MSRVSGQPAHVVILGASHGGMTVATELRAQGYDGRVTLVSGEPGTPYQRPHLSKECLSPEMPAPKPLRGAETLADRKIDLVAAEAVLVDRSNRRLQLSDGTTLDYDALVFATGAEARTLGRDIDPDGHTLVLRDATDGAALCAKLREAQSVALIGGGLIGLEVAAAARALGREVTVIEAAPRLMERSVYPAIAEKVLARHREEGMKIHLGARLASVSATGVVLPDGAELKADLVVAAIGSRPRTALASAAGLSCPDGISTDETGRTEDPAIFAAGDCAQWAGRRHESVAAAQAQGKTVAAAILGASAPDPAPLRLWSTQGTLRLQMSGEMRPDAVTEQEEAGGGTLLRASVGDRLVAVQALDAPRAFNAALSDLARAETERAPA